jgi:hypothetical protein
MPGRGGRPIAGSVITQSTSSSRKGSAVSWGDTVSDSVNRADMDLSRDVGSGVGVGPERRRAVSGSVMSGLSTMSSYHSCYSVCSISNTPACLDPLIPVGTC